MATVVKTPKSDPQPLPGELAAHAHRIATDLYERYYGHSISELAAALGTTRDTARSWLEAPPSRVRRGLLDRARRLWVLCRTGNRYIAGSRKVGLWSMAPHIGLQGRAPAEVLIDDQDDGLLSLLNEMISYTPARPDLPHEVTDEELRETLHASLDPATAERMEKILASPESEVTEDDLSELAAFDSE